MPGYLWWDFACRISDDSEPSDAITEFGPFLSRHSLPLALAVSSQRGIAADILASLRSRWRDLLEDGVNDATAELLGGLVEGFAHVDPLGIGWVVNRLREVARWQMDRSRAMRKLSDTSLLEGPADLAGDLARHIRSLTDGVLPAVIAIEDLHWAGEDTLSLLTRMRDLRVPATILATAWLEGKEHDTYQRLLDQLDGYTTVCSVKAPDRDEITQLISHFAPTTPTTEACKVADRWSNPFALITMLTLPRVRKSIERHHGCLEWGSDFGRPPHSLEGLYYDRLDQLPTDVKIALSVAAGSLPGISEMSASQAFLPRTVADAACAVEAWVDRLPDEAAVESALQT